MWDRKSLDKRKGKYSLPKEEEPEVIEDEIDDERDDERADRNDAAA
jgi:hypothetical protein